MRKHRRTYTYRVTARGIGYVMAYHSKVPDEATFIDDWCIYRRHDTKHSPWNFEVWINDIMFVDRWTAETMRRWRKFGYIIPHADMRYKHIRYTEKLLSKISITEDK